MNNIGDGFNVQDCSIIFITCFKAAVIPNALPVVIPNVCEESCFGIYKKRQKQDFSMPNGMFEMTGAF